MTSTGVIPRPLAPANQADASRNTAGAATWAGPARESMLAISKQLNGLLADLFALYVKTKSFHWHMHGPQFRDHHLLLDEQATAILETLDPVAERARKIGATTLRSIGQVADIKRVADCDRDDLTGEDMLQMLLDDNRQLALSLRAAHQVCDHHHDIATTSLLENWVDEAEGRVWFLAATLAKRA